MKTITEISKILKIPRQTLYNRMNRYGNDINKALSIHGKHRFNINGKTMTLKEISEEFRININTLASRIRQGISIHDAIKMLTKQQKVKHYYCGKSMTLKEWAIYLNEPLYRFKARFYKHNKSIKFAIESSKNFNGISEK